MAEEQESIQAANEDALAVWAQNNAGQSYSQAFNIRQVMYRIQDFDLPFKRGLRVEQFLAFLVGLLLSFVIWSIIISPLTSLLHIKLTWTLIALWFLAPPILLSQRIGKPMPHNKTIPGTLMSFMRDKLDDTWHRRGLPVSYAPEMEGEIEGNYMRTWSVDPAYGTIESKNDMPATEFENAVEQDLPDGPVNPDGIVKQRRRILEDDDAFYERINAGVVGYSTKKEDEPEGSITLLAKGADAGSEAAVDPEDMPRFEEEEEEIAIFDPSTIRRKRDRSE